MSTTQITAEPGVQELEITREFAAPAELVFRAWTDPELFVQWIGPRRLTTRVEVWEVRDGGRWRFVSEDPEHGEFGFHGVFHGDPSASDGIVWTFEFEGAPGNVILEKVTFTEVDGRTTVRTHSVYQSVAARDGMISAGMQTGIDEGYAKLDELLASRTVRTSVGPSADAR